MIFRGLNRQIYQRLKIVFVQIKRLLKVSDVHTIYLFIETYLYSVDIINSQGIFICAL